MTKRIINIGLCAAVLIVSISAFGVASNLRETPAVLAIKRARAAVVNIHSEKTAVDGNSLFSNSKSRKINGMGTGIIIDERGYIVTNQHVVAGVDSLRVTLYDGSVYRARVVSYDRKHDLAIIKVNPTKRLAIMPLGTSSDLMLGETVIAIGNAFGYKDTATGGMVSALSRDVEVNEKQSYKRLIQTDASINPGNSGGPLINLDGEVVGINVAIRAGAQRIGFAIPIDDARKVIAQLLSIEQLNHTRHGLIASDFKKGTQRLLIVDSAHPNSPAETAGFKKGDVILKVGDVDVADGTDFERSCLEHDAGDELQIVIRRNDQQQTLKLELASFGSQPSIPAGTIVRANNSDESAIEKAWRLMGMRVARVNGNTTALAGSRYRGGMRVTAVRPESPAASNGIRQGDILVGLHVWETINYENLSYVIDHPQLSTFSPLKFYILRGNETLFGHLSLALRGK